MISQNRHRCVQHHYTSTKINLANRHFFIFRLALTVLIASFLIGHYDSISVLALEANFELSLGASNNFSLKLTLN